MTEDVPDDVSRDTYTCQDTTPPHEVWVRHAFAGLFRELRNLNAHLPKSQRASVLLSGLPTD
ncbi:hypothetical protein EN871_21520 [bacterium M00.F.Ca.ET.228.01.1.1]|uniref:hypothetical protein n=1 Tax=Paraburkholderia phenoliruptrix TaxID=252970 RepID=UPI001091FD3A|nr:hypothetical protein [Paraburkholderia phenoliruptrix]TGP42124.1 hypothetical protein EN871_21520 [bacterium M00.F.Ca.ET.228.01.1.1]TGR99555.1 hypothetical protein EN834_19705 [bacterium M00.F.Ca.ET.191.01.1.1]TGU03922.1 hypothetical protein EN798_20525 [bacterium M00.F.Ca.ET.155.01.1.1]MBW0448319.1 hypothetical protein [Paraburkholderia phenoliruptrix]MBW9099530.1 hypothetical protein [Paraburkholderia phenoliruptrix]